MDEMNIWKATEQWVRVVEETYKDFERGDLTQVFARGPFAGMSEREVVGLANRFRESMTKFPFRNE